ncbi:hypothetical protein AB0M97_26550 [Streptomyces sp. NPDC051207]|uniref:hypothetical protein n=1 Tax=Streptomyces sp. NPDC051207 TaxID=3154641 RepID=UPI003440AA69
MQKKAGERDQEERWAMLAQSAYALFSGAPHDDSGTTENFTWTRADARHRGRRHRRQAARPAGRTALAAVSSPKRPALRTVGQVFRHEHYRC